MSKAMIAMSGGVDSSVAAYLTMREGFEVIGATMKLFDRPDLDIHEKTCCSLDDVMDAKSVCTRLGINHYVFNMKAEFDAQVMSRFADIYRTGATPNPCIDCNRYIKFNGLLRRALELDCDYIVTGHYASIEFDRGSERWLLKRAADTAKDQTYFLYPLTQYQLSHTRFPVGALTKPEVRQIAEDNGFVNSRKHDSQDICFVPDGDYVSFIEGYFGEKCEGGDFIDMHGNVIGHHNGTIRYTIGQRKGLGMGFNKPMYVCAKDVAHRTVTLSDNSDLFSCSVTVRDINMIACEKVMSPIRVKAKIRYSQRDEWATLEQTADDEFHLEFDTPQRAIAPGQAAVCYDGDVVVCGGTII